MQKGHTYHYPPNRDLDFESGFHNLMELQNVRVASLFPAEIDAIAELLLAKVVLGPQESICLHTHPSHSEAIFVLRGAVVAQRGLARAEIRPHGCAYFPAGAPHSITAIPGTDAEFLMFYPRADVSLDVRSEVVDSSVDQSRWPNPNVVKGTNLLWRWAVAEESEPWIPTEPTKGMDNTVRFLFDPPRGCPDLVIGTGLTQPHHHYTIHRHAPAEFYYILDGRMTYYIGDETYEVEPGSTLYVPAMLPHGADTHETQDYDFWVYGLDGCGADWVWEAQEDIYNTPRSQ